MKCLSVLLCSIKISVKRILFNDLSLSAANLNNLKAIHNWLEWNSFHLFGYWTNAFNIAKENLIVNTPLCCRLYISFSAFFCFFFSVDHLKLKGISNSNIMMSIAIYIINFKRIALIASSSNNQEKKKSFVIFFGNHFDWLCN